MNEGKTVFSQIMSYFPRYIFDKKVLKYKGNYRVRNFKCWDQFLCMCFAQYLIHMAKDLYRFDKLEEIDLDNIIYALDSTTIDLCLSLFPWAKFRSTKGAIKLHTLLDLKGSIPTFIEITEGAVHDVNILDVLIPEPGSYYIMDRAYIDYKRLYRLNMELGYFVVRAKKNLRFRRIYSSKVDKSKGLRCDQIIKLTGHYQKKDYPEKLRRVKFYDVENKKYYVFLTNNFEIPAMTVASLYKSRWQVELFFKWIKQHLRIKTFFGTSFNAVRSQIWISICIYVIIAIIKKSEYS